jgi:hypothetical protein
MPCSVVMRTSMRFKKVPSRRLGSPMLPTANCESGGRHSRPSLWSDFNQALATQGSSQMICAEQGRQLCGVGELERNGRAIWIGWTIANNRAAMAEEPCISAAIERTDQRTASGGVKPALAKTGAGDYGSTRREAAR